MRNLVLNSTKVGLLLLCLIISFVVSASPKNIITIDITSHLGDTQSFVSGDTIRFLISLDADAYITVIYQMSDGQLLQLLPNEKEKNTFYKAGLFITVPNELARYQFTIQAPYGKERVWVFASDMPQKILLGKKLDNGLRLLTTSLKKIKLLFQQNSTGKYGQASFMLFTRQSD